MNAPKVVLEVVCVSLLTGCMTGGVGRTDRVGGGGYGGALQYAEATTGDLTIALSFPAPGRSSAVAIEGQLTAANDPHELIDGEMWLRIQTPSGSVDEVRMQRMHASAAAGYEAMYHFRAPGSYLVTAEGWTEREAGTHEASVTTSVVVVEDSHYADHRTWMMPMAVLGGLGMVVMMVVMMGS